MENVSIYNSQVDQISLEQVTADYLGEAITEPPQTLYRIDDRGVRFYYSLDAKYNPTFYGSSTTIKSLVTPTPRPIIDKELEMGTIAFRQYRNNRAAFGTLWHILASELTAEGFFELGTLDARIADYAGREGVGSTDGWALDAWKGLLSWIQTMNDYQIKPLAIELPLAHEDGYAGTIDLVCEMYDKKYTSKTPEENRNRIIAIIDWKTGYIFPDHAIQLHLNRRIWQANYPQIIPERLFNWTWRDWRSSPSYQLTDQTDSEEAELIEDYLHIWKTKYFSKPRNIKTAGGRIQVGQDTSKMYREQSIEQYVKQKHEDMEVIK